MNRSFIPKLRSLVERDSLYPEEEDEEEDEEEKEEERRR